MPVILETFHEFRQRHPGEPVALPDAVWLFPDGSRYPMNELPGRGVEPPSDRFAALRLQRQYVEHNLNREVRARREFKELCLSQLSFAKRNVGGEMDGALAEPPPDAAEQLQAGAARIAKWQEQLDGIDRELQDDPEAIAWRQRRERDDQRRQRLQSFYNELAGA